VRHCATKCKRRGTNRIESKFSDANASTRARFASNDVEQHFDETWTDRSSARPRPAYCKPVAARQGRDAEADRVHPMRRAALAAAEAIRRFRWSARNCHTVTVYARHGGFDLFLRRARVRRRAARCPLRFEIERWRVASIGQRRAAAGTRAIETRSMGTDGARVLAAILQAKAQPAVRPRSKALVPRRRMECFRKHT